MLQFVFHTCRIYFKELDITAEVEIFLENLVRLSKMIRGKPT